MKTIKLIAAAAAMLCCTSTYAQFTPSTIGESIAGTTTGSVNTRTFNDCRNFKNFATGPTMVVNAVGWVGNSAGLYWEVPVMGASGSFALPSGVTQGDVAFSVDATLTNLYMNVVYTVGGNFFFDSYQWTGGGFILAGSGNWPDMAGTASPIVMIDATRNGDFAISTNYSDGSVDVAAGTNASLPATPGNVPAIGAGTATQTDICLNTNPFGTTTDVHLAFSDFGNNQVYTASAPFASLAFGPINTVVAAAPSTVYYDLHIASPNTNAPRCPNTEIFSIIYDEITPTYYYMHQYSEDGVGITNTVLTGGAAGFPTPAIQFSKRPGITYNEQWSFTLPGTRACWGATASGWVSALASPGSMVGEKNYSFGPVFGPTTYYNIDVPQRYNCDQFAISSKYAGNQLLVSYIDYNTNNIIYKVLAYNGATMKSVPGRAITGEMQKAANIYPNPVSDRIYADFANFLDDVQVQIVDVTGRTAYTYNGSADLFQHGANTWLSKATPGIYSVHITDKEGYNQTVKLVKQ